MRLFTLSSTVTLLALLPVACFNGEIDGSESETGESLGSVSSALNTTDTYEIQGVDSGKCLDVAGAGTVDGTDVQLWDCHKGGAQQFKLEDQGSGYFRLRNTNSDKCLEISGSSTVNGGQIKIWTCGTGANQKFRVTEAYGQAVLQNQNSNLFVEADAWGSANGTNIQQWSATGGANQQWRLNKLTGGSCTIPTSFSWTSSAMMVDPISNASHNLVSVKDPTIVYSNRKWHVYATVANTATNWHMVYFNFSNWADAANAPQYYMDQTANFGGYKCAPHVFFYTPQNKWYMVFQSQPPTYSTTTDIANPGSWTAPQPFYGTWPAGMPSLPIDYQIICDDNNCFNFFTGDNGKLYRAQTTRAAFPGGMSAPVVAISLATNDLFEASQVYKVKGMNKYIASIEAIGSGGRYFKLWEATALDGAWTPVASSESQPFAGAANVSYPNGDWTNDVSHGELLRSGNNERMEVDLCSGNMQFLYQGRDPNINVEYSQLPYRLGLLSQGQSSGGGGGGIAGLHKLKASYATSMCMEPAGSSSSGAFGQLWTCSTSANPNWNVVEVSTGVYELRAANGGLCLTVWGGNYTNGGDLGLYACSGQAGSRWNVTAQGSNYQFRSINNTAKCIDINAGGSANGTRLQIWDCSGTGTNQSFQVAAP
jgi:hypothetical protein